MKESYTKITQGILQKALANKKFVVQDFFVGLTDDPRKRLFKDHRVDRYEGLYVYVEAGSAEEAQKAYQELMDLDMNGTTVTGYKPGRYVYCYHINGQTVECPTCS